NRGDKVDEIVLAKAHRRQDREEHEEGCDDSLPRRKAAREPPSEQNPSHMQRRDGVARACQRYRFNQQPVDLYEAEVLPGKNILKNIDGAHRWEQVVENNSNGTSDEEGGHRREASARIAKQETRVHDGDDDGQANVEKEADGTKPGQLLKPLTNDERELNTQRCVEGVEIEVEDAWVQSQGKGQKIGGDPIRR